MLRRLSWGAADNTRNACHGSDAEEAAAQEAAFFFGAALDGSLGGLAALNCIAQHMLKTPDRCHLLTR